MTRRRGEERREEETRKEAYRRLFISSFSLLFVDIRVHSWQKNMSPPGEARRKIR